MFFIPNYHLYRTDRFTGRKGGTAIAVRKGIPQNHVYLPALISVDATGVYIPIGNSEMLLTTVCKPRGHAWNDPDITKLLSFSHMSLLAEDVNVKYQLWNSIVSNPADEKKTKYIVYINGFNNSVPICPTHYSPAGNGDMIDISVHKNIRLSDIIFFDIVTDLQQRSRGTPAG
jgi:hypothetical protein